MIFSYTAQSCKPNSVPSFLGGDHLSSPPITEGVKRAYQLLHLVGVCQASTSLPNWCALTAVQMNTRQLFLSFHTISTLPRYLFSQNRRAVFYLNTIIETPRFQEDFSVAPPLLMVA